MTRVQRKDNFLLHRPQTDGEIRKLRELISYVYDDLGNKILGNTGLFLDNTKIIESFPDSHGWTNNGVGIFSDQGTEINADRSYQIQTSGVGTESVATKTGISPVDLTRKHIVIALQIGFSSRLVNTKLRLASGNISTNYAEITLATQADASMLFNSAWHNISFPYEAFTEVGTVDWTSITSARVTALDNGAGIVTVKFGVIKAVPALTEGVISIAFDDGYASTYTKGMKRLARYGFPATAYIITDVVDTATWLTTAQIDQLHDFQGWDICPHALTINNHNLTNGLESLSDANCLTEISGLYTWMKDRGYSVRDIAYPKGNRGGSVLKYSRRYFTHGGRGTVQGPETSPAGDPWYIRGWSVDGLTTSVATIESFIDKAIADKSWGIITFHNIVTGAAASATEFNETNYNAVIDYLANSGVKVMKIGDVLSRPAL